MLMTTIAIAAIVIFLMVFIDRPNKKFVFKSGELVAKKGQIGSKLLHDFKEIAERNEVTGTIKIYQRKSNDKIVISKSVPNKIQQRFRNVYPHQVAKTKGKRRA
jgi:hypothetical protein